MTYTYLEHRADLYVQGEGRDRNEAIEGIADGLFNVTGKGMGRKIKLNLKKQELIFRI